MRVQDISRKLLDILKILDTMLKISQESEMEAVAHARNGQDKPWPLRPRFDFLAQERHVDMQAVCPGVRLVSPHLFQVTFAA